MDPNLLDLSILIISHGHEAEILGCVDSLVTAASGLTYEILVLDNLGQSLKNVLHLHHDTNVRVLNNTLPHGFARNVNQTARQARGRFLLLLNPDTVHYAGSIREIVELLRRDRSLAVASCRLLNTDLTFQPNYRRFPTVPVLLGRACGMDTWPYRPKFYRFQVMEGEKFSQATQVDWVFGAFMLVERTRFEEIGGMDEGFRMYYEDVDLCYRFRQRGLSTVYDPSVTFVHRHARDSAKRVFSQLRRWHLASGLRFFAKHRYLFRPPAVNFT